MLMSAKIGNKDMEIFDFLKGNMMVYVCGKFGVCSMFLSSFTKREESIPQHNGAIKSPARIELI